MLELGKAYVKKKKKIRHGKNTFPTFLSFRKTTSAIQKLFPVTGKWKHKKEKANDVLQEKEKRKQPTFSGNEKEREKEKLPA